MKDPERTVCNTCFEENKECLMGYEEVPDGWIEENCGELKYRIIKQMAEEYTTIGNIETVKQRTSYDCAVACLAMATGEKYEHVVANLPQSAKEALANKEGLLYEEDIQFLDLLGYDTEWEEVTGWKPDCDSAILTVPSLNFEDKKHAVYWDGVIVHDPSLQKCYETGKALAEAIFVIRVTPKYLRKERK